MQTAEEMVTLRKENEELKDVLSAVQIDLEARTEVEPFYHRKEWGGGEEGGGIRDCGFLVTFINGYSF